ncbi:PilZ domain-containing protein [Niallia sp. XMNu-256]|uniref:flagellar brake protein n=1 Tax=Niallia sp. XMNu-256 TaxID=3082444 RepID=UPI0030CEF02C
MFNTEVLGRVLQGIPMIKLRYPGDSFVIKIQRRQYVRVPAVVDVAIHPVQDEFLPFTTITEDISAGGSLLLLDQQAHPVQQGADVVAVFILPFQDGEYHYLKLRSKIIRRINEDETGRSLFSLQFLNVTSIERQTLLRFTFDRQLAMKKKGIDYNE